jgi:hypothetical protein
MLKNKLKGILNNYLDNSVERQLMLQGQILADRYINKSEIYNLSEVEFSVFSQWGEDGIINWLIHKIIDIPEIFIEFGVSDYRESNTRFLLKYNNWKGLVVDGSHENIDRVKRQDIYWKHELTAVSSFVTRENINQLFIDNNFTGDIGLLSIDIDGNDYWIWQAIECVSPVIVVCEYNAVFGDLNKISVPYNASFERTRAHHSNLYFGASLPALTALAKEKGYELVGTTSTGVNAFYVREDKVLDIKNKLDNVIAFPSRFRESRDKNNILSFVSGHDRLRLIQHLPVYDFDLSSEVLLKDYSNHYSTSFA